MSPGGTDRLLVRRHLLALSEALARLSSHADVTQDAYLADGDLQWLVERGLLVCVQNVLDIASHLAAGAGRDTPDYASSIDVLATVGVLPPEFARSLRPLAGFRNVLVHAYLTVKPELVHQVLSTKLSDLAKFAEYVEGYLGLKGP